MWGLKGIRNKYYTSQKQYFSNWICNKNKTESTRYISKHSKSWMELKRFGKLSPEQNIQGRNDKQIIWGNMDFLLVVFTLIQLTTVQISKAGEWEKSILKEVQPMLLSDLYWRETVGFKNKIRAANFLGWFTNWCYTIVNFESIPSKQTTSFWRWYTTLFGRQLPCCYNNVETTPCAYWVYLLFFCTAT